MSDHEATLICERDDCCTLTLTSPHAGASVGCPMPGCEKTVSIGARTANSHPGWVIPGTEGSGAPS
jgi:hypothetical protein